MKTLENRVAVISGAASGIGQAIATRLAAEGAVIEILDRQEATETCAVIHATQGNARFQVCDIKDDKKIDACVQVIADRHGMVDILVNNAGLLTARRPWNERSRDQLQEFISVNYLSAYSLVKAIYPLMKNSSRGRIIMIGSLTTFTCNADMAGYVESKAALTSLTKVLAQALGSDGIAVNTIAPGAIETPGSRINSTSAGFEQAMNKQAIKTPVLPEHIGAVVAFLASDDAQVITGQTVLCDGGVFLH